MPTYLLASGETIEYPTPAPAVAAFIARAQAMLLDGAHTATDLFALVHGPENPLLDTVSFPGRAIARKAALENPVYHMLSDFVYRKQLAASGHSPEAALAAFTLTVKDAAAQLGLTETAVRSAITARKLAAVKRNGEWYIRPESVAAYKVSNRGRKKAAEESAPPIANGVEQKRGVTVFCGSAAGGSLAVRIAHSELVIVDKKGNTMVAHFPPEWTRAAVKTTTANGVRVFELEPAAAEDAELQHEVKHLGFMVAGEFKVVKKHNATKTANEVWNRYAGAKAEA